MNLKLKQFLFKLYKKLPTLLFDLFAIPLSWYMAYWLRYNLSPFPQSLDLLQMNQALLVLMTVQTGAYYYFKVYRGLWRFSSIQDVVRIIKSTAATILLAIPVLYWFSLIQAIPRSVFPLYALTLITILCGSRLIKRCYRDQAEKPRSGGDVKRVLIIGAGQAGESLVRDLKRSHAYLPVGLVDDDPRKRGMEIHGVRVFGSTKLLGTLTAKHQVDLILIAIPTARSVTMRRLVNYCNQCQIPFQTLPSLSALTSGQVTINALRKVKVDDLLGRDEVSLEWSKIGTFVQGKRVVVTGGGGSIGSELCRQVLALQPQALLIIDNSEFNLYKIEQETQRAFPHLEVSLALISVNDGAELMRQFRHFKPQVVFHAAAYKHVPMLEHQVRVAILNNILGTKNAAQASVAVGAEKFILISTDKAVNPTNVMGTTKRIAEIYCQNLNERVNTQFITVRFGNVLGSAGSVVPLFQKQLQMGGPLTVTHPEIQRYFMTIPEACQLILQAMVNGQGGEIFVLDMGEPIKITYLAEQMIRLAGKKPGIDIAIKYTGLRPGEKLFEELFHESEQLASTTHEKLFQAKFRKLDWQELVDTIHLLNEACNNHDEEEMIVLLKSLVPEFKSERRDWQLTGLSHQN